MRIINKTHQPIRVDGNYLKPHETLDVINHSIVRTIHVDDLSGTGSCEIIVELKSIKFYNNGKLVATETSKKETSLEDKVIEVYSV